MADKTIVQAVIDRLTGKTAYVNETLKDIGGGELAQQVAVVNPDGTTVGSPQATAIGTKADAAATDSTSAWSGVALLKGLLSRFLPVTLSDYSGTCDGAAHTVLTADATRSRISLSVATTQASSVWVNSTGVATIDGVGSQEIAPGTTLDESDLGHPANAISLIGVSGIKYALKGG